jgi:hypothetical protein
MGNAMQTSGDAIYGARHVALKAGVPREVPALTVNRLCGSGLQSVVSAAQQIQTGEAEWVLAEAAQGDEGRHSRGDYDHGTCGRARCPVGLERKWQSSDADDVQDRDPRQHGQHRADNQAVLRRDRHHDRRRGRGQQRDEERHMFDSRRVSDQPRRGNGDRKRERRSDHPHAHGGTQMLIAKREPRTDDEHQHREPHRRQERERRLVGVHHAKAGVANRHPGQDLPPPPGTASRSRPKPTGRPDRKRQSTRGSQAHAAPPIVSTRYTEHQTGSAPSQTGALRADVDGATKPSERLG